MTVQIKTIDLEPKRQTFGHVARRLGGDKPASRYQEATFDLQPTDHFHYRPLWEPQFNLYDPRKTEVVMRDWYALLDPRQYYYGAYNIARANMNQAVERNFTFVEERDLFARADESLKAKLVTGLLPVRHLHWGANMNMTEICQRGYGTAVTAPSIFSAGDHLGMAQIISRIGLVIDAHTGTSLGAAKAAWMTAPAWQGARQLIEDTLVERDWFHLFVAQALGVNAVLLDLVYARADAAFGPVAIPVAMLTEFMADWAAEEGKWTDQVIRTAAAESAENAALVSGWARYWIDRAEAAGTTLSVLLVGDESAAVAAAAAARARAARLGLTL
ncbi:phenol hydroxylase [Xanthobacter sp. AM11]|uniref:phenol hydroxylase n=1 Tax=Xanthobacter sp. AM11 TaxID=3380643 RepID=UPI0039BF2574